MKKIVKTVALVLAALIAFSSTSFAATSYVGGIAFAKLTGIFAPVAIVADAFDDIYAQNVKNQPEKEPELIDRGHFAYVVSANQRLNSENGLYYAELVLINETGIFEVKTVDDVENYNFMPVLTADRIGKIPSLEGKFIQFDMKKTDKIQKLEPRRSVVKTKFSNADGFYLVNVADERNNVLSFYDTEQDVTVAGARMQSCAYHSDGHAIIAISDDDYTGAFLHKISRKTETLPAGVGNAVIQISEGEIVRVFSFEDGFEA